MPLDKYHSKRDFSKTTEPEGKQGKAKGGSRFVVHKHQASHLHYDFRLEMDGWLKSWAVPKGMPLQPSIKRLAVQVEDHPLDYIDFAGEIPQGQYGAGTVEIWDHGHYKVDKRGNDVLELTLEGNRLTGGYILVHTGGKNWLLFKRKADQ